MDVIELANGGVDSIEPTFYNLSKLEQFGLVLLHFLEHDIGDLSVQEQVIARTRIRKIYDDTTLNEIDLVCQLNLVKILMKLMMVLIN